MAKKIRCDQCSVLNELTNKKCGNCDQPLYNENGALYGTKVDEVKQPMNIDVEEKLERDHKTGHVKDGNVVEGKAPKPTKEESENVKEVEEPNTTDVA